MQDKEAVGVHVNSIDPDQSVKPYEIQRQKTYLQSSAPSEESVQHRIRAVWSEPSLGGFWKAVA